MAEHHGSAYLSTKRAIESAEDRGFDAGRECERGELMRLIAEYFERTGRPELAGEVLSLKLVEKG